VTDGRKLLKNVSTWNFHAVLRTLMRSIWFPKHYFLISFDFAIEDIDASRTHKCFVKFTCMRSMHCITCINVFVKKYR